MMVVMGKYIFGTSDEFDAFVILKSVVENVCSPSLLLSFVFVFVIIYQECVVKKSYYSAACHGLATIVVNPYILQICMLSC
jgi:hypothetical protein